MLLNLKTLAGVKSGAISVAFRRWRRPTVKSGGTLLTAIGQLAIDSVDPVSLESISQADAAAAGFADLDSLQSVLLERSEGDVYRVALRFLGADPRIALRSTIPTGTDLDSLVAQLRRFDSRSAAGPWTLRVLQVVSAKPAVRAADLATEVGMERSDFKTRVRKLKRLGLTESLKVGYRLSPRGDVVMGHLVTGAT